MVTEGNVTLVPVPTYDGLLMEPILLALVTSSAARFHTQGASFKVFGRGNCLEYSLPQHPDLILMEHLPYLEGEGDTDLNLEILLNRLRFTLNFTLLPPIIFMVGWHGG